MPKGIYITGMDKVLKAMKDYGEEKKKAVDTIFKEGARKIEAKAKRAAPVDEGGIRGAISWAKVGDNYEVSAQKDYAVFVETGTKKNFDVDPEFASYVAQFKGQKTGGDFDKAILEWVKRKGIKFEKAGQQSIIGGKKKRQPKTVRTRYLTTEQTAFIIARFISFHGIKAQPYLLPAFVEVRKEIIDQIKKEFGI